MASVINTNIASLNAQRNLSTSQSALNTSIQRLSTGLRINSAKDDAAGLAISERFTTQINGLNQAVRNANDGISLAQTAEGALSTIGNNLQRIRTLAVQSRNATNSPTDREALQKEVSQLTAEIDRVAKDTSFNGTNLLDGSFLSKSFQVGANAGQRITIDRIANANTNALGSSYNSSDTGAVAAMTATTTGAYTAASGSAAATATAPAFATVAASAISITITNGDGSTETFNSEALSAITGSAPASSADVADQETAIKLQRLEDVAAEIGRMTNGRVTAAVSDDKKGIEILSSENFSIATTATATTGLAAGAATEQVGFRNLDVKTVESADKMILAMDAALRSVSESRAELGAIQNRFTSVVSNLQTTAENLASSRSRILDTDFAEETANLTRGQILQQAGTAMLAQANSLPNTVLTLLQG